MLKKRGLFNTKIIVFLGIFLFILVQFLYFVRAPPEYDCVEDSDCNLGEFCSYQNKCLECYKSDYACHHETCYGYPNKEGYICCGDDSFCESGEFCSSGSNYCRECSSSDHACDYESCYGHLNEEEYICCGDYRNCWDSS
jgi:hypothetical protein